MLPIQLIPNYVSIYGAPSTQGISYGTPGYQFGVVDQIYGQNPNLVAVDQSVFFKIDDSVSVQYGGNTYYLVEEQKIVFIENSGLP